MGDKQLFEFTQDGFYAGTYYKTGARVRLHPKEAKYELHRLKPVASPAVQSSTSKPADSARMRLSERSKVKAPKAQRD